MAKRRRKQSNIKNNTYYFYGSYIGIIISTVVLYFHLFFIGDWIGNIIEKIFGYVFLLYILIDAFCVLKLSNLESKIKMHEYIGALLFYFSFSMIANKGLVYVSLGDIFSLIISSNLATLLYFISLFASIVLMAFRAKDTILNEINNGVSKTEKIVKEKRLQKENNANEQVTKLQKKHDFDYMQNYLENTNVYRNSLLDNIHDTYLNSFSSSIYNYIDSIKDSMNKLAIEQNTNLNIVQTITDMEFITIEYKISNHINKKLWFGLLNKLISNCTCYAKEDMYFIKISYASSNLVTYKDLISNYNTTSYLPIGIDKYGYYINANNSNLLVIGSNHFENEKICEQIYLTKSFSLEEIYVVDLTNNFFNSYKDSANIKYEFINNITTLELLVEKLKKHIITKEEYVYDLGFNSYEQYKNSENYKQEPKINVFFNEISSIILDTSNPLYVDLLFIVRKSLEFNITLIFTNSLSNQDIFDSALAKHLKQRIFTKINSNSFSNLLVQDSSLTKLTPRNIIYQDVNKNTYNTYVVHADENKDKIHAAIGQNFDKIKLEVKFDIDPKIYKQVRKDHFNGIFITKTYLVTKYNISSDQATKIIKKVKNEK